jgi:bifunctional UDP-N-acetylglucosamine pyrophosphorylase/glucosamine-1-phosphate N-acetyltransferase
MRSAVPKVLHPLLGRPMILWPVRAAQDAGAARVVVVDGPDRPLDGRLPEGVEVAVQSEPKGTGDAVRAAAQHIDREAPVVVLFGDVPLVSPEIIRELGAAHARTGAVATMATTELEDPSGYGRVVRAGDGSVERVVETKVPGDASPAELAIREVSTGLFAFDGGALLDALERVTPDNVQGEIYLPDVLPIMRADGCPIAAHPVIDPHLTLGVNDRVHLAHVHAAARRLVNERLMRAGVTILDPATTYIEADVEIAPDTVVEPSTFLRGATSIGGGCTIGPLTTLIDSEVGDRVTIVQSYVTGARLNDGATIGPFAFVRPGTHLHEDTKAGAFVEIKNSEIGRGAKVPHLSYIGDADIGEGANIGAGSITANYDGVAKHRTRIGRNTRISVDTMFVAPVSVGDDAYTGAGSVIVDDVPPGALGIARERQRNVEGYAERRARKQR